MSIKAMHYQFKQMLNKIDSSQNINFLVPEIDEFIRQAEVKFILDRAIKTSLNKGSLDANNRISEELRNIIVSYSTNTLSSTGSVFSFLMPENYFFFIRGTVTATKGGVTRQLKILYRNSTEEINSFNSSSFEWQEVYATFSDGVIKLFTDSSFVITSVVIDYIKRPLPAYDAEDSASSVKVLGSLIKQYHTLTGNVPKGLTVAIGSVVDGNEYTIRGYKNLQGEILFGYRDSEMPEIAHNEIVNIAVKTVIENIKINMSVK